MKSVKNPFKAVLSQRGLWQTVAGFMFGTVLFTLLLTVFHHHEDGNDHEQDCSICYTLHHRQSDAVVTAPVLNYLPLVLATFISTIFPFCHITRFSQSPENRAPPF